ncbi:cobalt-precorrin-6Y C(15)-methyltransferase [Salmonella enterica subsp. enterica]|nr:cobalt-precorrin-6Y C(15)-methyltransferase [Salmonella enterica subsp. enterica]
MRIVSALPAQYRYSPRRSANDHNRESRCGVYGRSGGHLTALIDWAMGHLHPGGRLVMTFILQENLHSALAHLAHIGACRMDCVQLQLSSLTPLGAGHYFKPNNPVFVIACQKEENHVRDI